MSNPALVPPVLRACGRQLILDRPMIMGVLNVTPDSFSDGGRFLSPDAALARAHEMMEEGVDLLDVGAESSRPGAEPIDEAEERRRLVPVLKAICRGVPVPVSVDTTKATVAREALELGACIINDISALRFDPDMAAVIQSSGAGLIVMHMQGTPKTMQVSPHYDDVIGEVRNFLRDRLRAAREYGIGQDQILIDPGIGFGKRLQDNLTLLAQLDAFAVLQRPILVGVSRKGFIGQILKRPVEERLMGTAAACAVALMKGASILRVHDVAPIRDLAVMLQAIVKSQTA